MNNTDQIRFSRRSEIDRIAREILDQEIRIHRATMGTVAAFQHGQEVAGDYQRRAYEALEREFPA